MSQETLDIHLQRANAAAMLQMRLAVKRGDDIEARRIIDNLHKEMNTYVDQTMLEVWKKR